VVAFLPQRYVRLILLLLLATPLHANDWLAAIPDTAFKQCLSELAAQQQWSDAAAVREIVCHAKGINSVDGINAFVNVEKISLYNNSIAALDLVTLPKLRQLNLARNKLKSLSLPELPLLNELFLFNNQMQQLDLPALAQLQTLKANSNKLTAFRYRGLPLAEKIYLFDNKLPTMDIDHLPKLHYMDVRQNPMPDDLYQRMDAMKAATILHDGNAPDWK